MNRNQPCPELQPTRRRFLQSSAAVAVPTIISASALGTHGAPPPSDRITLGVIGCGARGAYVMNWFLARKEVRVVAICDVDRLHYRDRAPGKGPAYGRQPIKARLDKHYDESGSGVTATTDYRELCNRADIDTVLVATPDHWHALCNLAAIRAGKDVYGEKPVTHTFHEGLVLCREIAEHGTVFQTGTQQRSDKRFRRAVELVRNGHLGKIQRIEVGLPPGYAEPQGDVTITEPPESLDYDSWCGPAEVLPYMRARHHRWWRGHTAYGGGVLMDWIGHHNDIAHWALDLDNSGPTRVEAVNWVPAGTEIYDTPAQYEIRCQYDGGIESLISSQNELGTKFIGTDGWVHVRRGRTRASDKRWIENAFDVGSQRVYHSENHVANFLECVKSRRTCVAPAETNHRSITPGHLGYISHALGRPIQWDAESQRAVNDESADELLRRHQYREPWSIQGSLAANS